MRRRLDVLLGQAHYDHAVRGGVEREAAAGHRAGDLPRVAARVAQVDREPHATGVGFYFWAENTNTLELGDAVASDRGGNADALQGRLGGEVRGIAGVGGREEGQGGG